MVLWCDRLFQESVSVFPADLGMFCSWFLFLPMTAHLRHLVHSFFPLPRQVAPHAALPHLLKEEKSLEDLRGIPKLAYYHLLEANSKLFAWRNRAMTSFHKS